MHARPANIALLQFAGSAQASSAARHRGHQGLVAQASACAAASCVCSGGLLGRQILNEKVFRNSQERVMQTSSEDVEKLGTAGRRHRSKPGYARNSLLPNKNRIQARRQMKALERIRGALARRPVTELDDRKESKPSCSAASREVSRERQARRPNVRLPAPRRHRRSAYEAGLRSATSARCSSHDPIQNPSGTNSGHHLSKSSATSPPKSKATSKKKV